MEDQFLRFNGLDVTLTIDLMCSKTSLLLLIESCLGVWFEIVYFGLWLV